MQSPPAEKNIFKKSMRLMGNHFEISVVGTAEAWAYEMIDKAVTEISRIETLLTTYAPGSDTNRINEKAGIEPVKVSEETFALIERSLRISAITQGAFDISYGSVDKSLWNFDQEMTQLPDPATARQMVRLINYRNILLNPETGTVFLREKGMRIGFGGIGKGYAAEMAKRLLKQSGVESGIVNASGDLTAWGYQPDGKPWTIGIVNPNFAGKIFSYMNVTDVAVVINEPIITPPNAFSPNGDGVHDVWEIPLLNLYPDCIVEVFNRLGQQLFRSVGYGKPWDGTYNGINQPVGTYYYVIKTRYDLPPVGGSVTIVR